MKNRAYALTLLASLLITLQSCGLKVITNTINPKPFNPTEAKTVYDLDMPFEQAWDGAVDFFAVQNLGIEVIDKSSGLIVGRSIIGDKRTSSYWMPDSGLYHKSAWIAVQYADNLKENGRGMRTSALWNIRIKPTADGKSRLFVNLSTPTVDLYLTTIFNTTTGESVQKWVRTDLEAMSTGNFENLLYRYILAPDRSHNVANRRGIVVVER